MSKTISTQVREIEELQKTLQEQLEDLQDRCKHTKTKECIKQTGYGCWGEKEWERWKECRNCHKILRRS